MMRRSSWCRTLANVVVVVVSQWSLCTAAAAVTPTIAAATPTPTACETFPPPKLNFQFSAEPAHPVVGDIVALSFDVSGRGGIPAYTLSGAAPIFQGDTSNVGGGPLGNVTFHLLAVQTGTAMLTLFVDYETALGCVEQPYYQFVYDTSPPFGVQVGPGGPTPTATATPTPGACLGDCDGSGVVTVDELILGVNLVLGAVDVTACPSFACTGDPGVVVVNCIIVAVNNALAGCSPPTPTPTPTRPCPTPRPTLTDVPCGPVCDGSCQTLGTTGFCQSLDGTCTCVPFFPTLTPTIPCG